MTLQHKLSSPLLHWSCSYPPPEWVWAGGGSWRPGWGSGRVLFSPGPPAAPSSCVCPGTPSWQCFNWLFSPDYLFQTSGEELQFFVTFLSNILLVPLSLQHSQRLRLLSQKSQKTALLIVILSILLLGQQAQKQPSALKGKEKGAVPKGRRTILFCHFPIWLGSKLKF